jgi:hypothetical protein
LGVVTANGVKVDQAASEDQRTIGSGAFHFEDGSTVSVASATGGYGVTVVQSFRLPDGSLYTVVRIKGDGEVDVSVTPGSTFEVVSPSAIIGVRGTEFTVRTSSNGDCTDVGVDDGAVVIENRTSKEVHLLKREWTGCTDIGGATGVDAPVTVAQQPASEPTPSPTTTTSGEPEPTDRKTWREAWKRWQGHRADRKKPWGHKV